jgi:hypothetical protein
LMQIMKKIILMKFDSYYNTSIYALTSCAVTSLYLIYNDFLTKFRLNYYKSIMLYYHEFNNYF